LFSYARDSSEPLLFSELCVADFLITCHIYESCGLLTPGELTDLRSALVNNVTFASLAVRNGFHKFLKYNSSKLMDMIDNFVTFQEEHNHAVNEEVSLCWLAALLLRRAHLQCNSSPASAWEGQLGVLEAVTSVVN
jgi:dsRNA-specific ribonuclease